MEAEHRAFWVIGSLAAMGGALFASFVTSVWWSLAGGQGTWFLVLALVGVLPTFVALAQSIDGRGHPGRWIGASAAVYVVCSVIAYG